MIKQRAIKNAACALVSNADSSGHNTNEGRPIRIPTVRDSPQTTNLGRWCQRSPGTQQLPDAGQVAVLAGKVQGSVTILHDHARAAIRSVPRGSNAKEMN